MLIVFLREEADFSKIGSCLSFSARERRVQWVPSGGRMGETISSISATPEVSLVSLCFTVVSEGARR